MNIKYFLIGNSMVLNWEGTTYTLNQEDHRYSKISEAIKNKTLDLIPELLDPTKVLNKEGFSVKDGIVYFKEQAIPTILGDEFLTFKVDKTSFISVVNFWLNLKNRSEFDNAKELIVALLSKKAYPVTEDGFLLVYKDPAHTPIVFNPKNKVSIPFFNYSHCPTRYMELFDNRKTFNEILEEIFGFNTKKLQKLVKEKMFVQGRPYLSYEILNYGLTFKNLLTPDNIFSMIEKNVLPDSPLTGDFTHLNSFLYDLSLTKEGKVSAKKIMNLLESKNTKTRLLDCARLYVSVKEKVVIDLESADFTANIDKIYTYLRRESDKLKYPNYPLEVEKLFPYTSKIKNALIDKMQLVFPKENYDLVTWSQKMSNCIHDFGQRILSGQSFVCAILDDKGEMLYNLEIGQGKIIQFRSYNNGSPKAADQKPIVEFLYANNVIHEKKGENCNFD